jgi:hypothetical protein
MVAQKVKYFNKYQFKNLVKVILNFKLIGNRVILRK